MIAPEPIPCSAGCKRSILPDDLSKSGWECLPITGRYRCGQCWRELREVNERFDTRNKGDA